MEKMEKPLSNSPFMPLPPPPPPPPSTPANGRNLKWVGCVRPKGATFYSKYLFLPAPADSAHFADSPTMPEPARNDDPLSAAELVPGCVVSGRVRALYFLLGQIFSQLVFYRVVFISGDIITLGLKSRCSTDKTYLNCLFTILPIY